MSDIIITVGLIIGGLGLFLLAVGMITDGLRLAAGVALRKMLGQWTRTPKHGILTGFIITSIVQSSSAITVATIGFVNAGLLTLYQALGVIYGANIGTTITGWLVAVIGFNFKIELFALPLIGIGMILRLVGGGSRFASIGIALAGFGLFFIGIDVLKDAFESIAASIDLRAYQADGVKGLMIFLGVGILMTVLTQSSSAAIAITLTATSGGVLDFNSAAAMIIGANVGTTSTAAFSVIGATPNAKRVAAAHIIFNVVTAFVALLIIPILFIVIGYFEKALGLEQVPTVTLALFHTTFNILGVLLVWPVSAKLSQFLQNRFTSIEEIESRPKFLDKNIAMAPVLSINAVTMEVSRIFLFVRKFALSVLSEESGTTKNIEKDISIINKLTKSVSDFITELEKNTLTPETASQLSTIVRIEQHMLTASDFVVDIHHSKEQLEEISDEIIQSKYNEYLHKVVNFINTTDLNQKDFSIVFCQGAEEEVKKNYSEIKNYLVSITENKSFNVAQIIEVLELVRFIRNMTKQMMKCTRYINELTITTETPVIKEEQI